MNSSDLDYTFHVLVCVALTYVVTPSDVLTRKLFPPFIGLVGAFSVVEGHHTVGVVLVVLALVTSLLDRAGI